MEMMFTSNYIELSQNEMEIVNGGLETWKKVLLLTLGGVCVAWALPLAIMALVSAGTLAAFGTGLSMLGLGFIGLGIGTH